MFNKKRAILVVLAAAVCGAAFYFYLLPRLRVPKIRPTADVLRGPTFGFGHFVLYQLDPNGRLVLQVSYDEYTHPLPGGAGKFDLRNPTPGLHVGALEYREPRDLTQPDSSSRSREIVARWDAVSGEVEVQSTLPHPLPPASTPYSVSVVLRNVVLVERASKTEAKIEELSFSNVTVGMLLK
jgi:hypothetical protein